MNETLYSLAIDLILTAMNQTLTELSANKASRNGIVNACEFHSSLKLTTKINDRSCVSWFAQYSDTTVIDL